MSLRPCHRARPFFTQTWAARVSLNGVWRVGGCMKRDSLDHRVERCVEDGGVLPSLSEQRAAVQGGEQSHGQVGRGGAAVELATVNHELQAVADRALPAGEA